MALNNTITLTSNLGSNAEAYSDKNGKTFYRLTIATADTYQNERGEWTSKDTVWHTVFAFSPKAKDAASYYRTGQRVKITGFISYRKTSATLEGAERTFQEAIIIARSIDPAPLPKAKR